MTARLHNYEGVRTTWKMSTWISFQALTPRHIKRSGQLLAAERPGRFTFSAQQDAVIVTTYTPSKS
jgi:hypothetical protein